MTGFKLKWVELRYRTKRGEKRKVRVVDIADQLEKLIVSLEKNGCHSFNWTELKHHA